MMVGIEIGPGTLRGVLATGRDGRSATVPFSCRIEDLSVALSALMAAMDTRSRKIALAIPSSWCSYRTVSFPYKHAARVEGTLDYALEDRLPGPVGEYVVEPLTELILSGEKGSRTLVAACKVEIVSALIEACRTAGVEAAVIQPSGVAVARDLNDRFGAQACRALIVRFDGEFCELVWLGQGDVRAAQAFRILSPDGEAVAARIRLALRAYEVSDGKESFDKAFLFSTDGKDGVSAETLEETLGVPVTVPGGDETGAPFAAARGVAAAATMDRHLAVNLRRGRCAYAPYAGKTHAKIAAALLIAAGIVLVFAMRTGQEIGRLRNAISQSRARQAEVFAEVVGRPGAPALRPMEAALAELKAEADRAGGGEVVSCLRRWTELKKQVPPESSIVFETIDIKQGGIAIEARAADRREAWQLRERLSESGIFLPDPPAISTQPRAGVGASFSMQLRYLQ